jgi:hypothetical protein
MNASNSKRHVSTSPGGAQGISVDAESASKPDIQISK